MIKRDELDYDNVRSALVRLYEGAENDAGRQRIEHGAQSDHSLAVRSALQDTLFRVSCVHNALTNDQAKYFMLHGAGRRLRMLHAAYQHIIDKVPPGRTDPLKHEEQQDLTIYVNIIYINARGLLDNYAWTLLYQKCPLQPIIPRKVDLFGPSILDNDAFRAISPELASHKDWNKEVKERRDPVAHRIPSYMPSSLLVDDAERKQWEDLATRRSQAAMSLEREAADQAFDKMENLGTFPCWFAHHPDEPVMPIYPTLPTDLAHVVLISEIVMAFLQSHE